jgi:hypothetical protein
MTTLNDFPPELFLNHIFRCLVIDPDFDMRQFIKYSTTCKYWYSLIYNNDFINICLKHLDVTRPILFNSIISPIERMKVAINKVYIHDISLQNKLIPMCNSVYDLLISNSFKVRGNIEEIRLYSGDNNKIIDLELINNIDYNYLSQIDIYTNLPHFPNNINLWKLEMYLGYEELESCKTIHLFSTNKPSNYNFRIKGNCKVDELDLNTHIYREMHMV